MPRYFRSNDGTEVRVNVPKPVSLDEEFQALFDVLETEEQCDTIDLNNVNKAIDTFKNNTAYLSRINELLDNGYVEYDPPSKVKKSTKTPKVVIDEVILNEDGSTTSLKVTE